MVMTTEGSEVRKTLGTGFEKYMQTLLKEQRISMQSAVRITKMEGDNDLEAIFYNQEKDYENKKIATTEYFIKPDLVIVENGIGRPK